MVKYTFLLESVAADTPRHGWRMTLPPILFGSKHAILYQMALIPLTMSRFSITALADSSSFLDRFVPLNRAIQMHKIFAYTMVMLVIFATFLFILYFSTLCFDGQQEFCRGLKSEIMVTVSH